MTRITNIVAIAFALSILIGCTRPSSTSSIAQTDTAGLNQGEYCETQEMAAPAHCKPGQRVVFLPSRFGNEQLPVIFAAANCDLRFSVVVTNGGVTCIFMRVKAADVPPTEAPAAG